MHYPLKIISIITLLTATASHSADNPATAQALIQSSKVTVFPLRTALDANSPKASYGTAFVIGKKGFLATNFHVVSSAVHDPKKYQLFLDIEPGRTLPAQVIAVDILHDLALIRVDHEFPSENSLLSREPSSGERLYSVGVPKDLNLSIVEGNYNGIERSLTGSQFVLSSPINSGMSGGPTYDASGSVLGVNVATLRTAQNISFLVPASYLQALHQKSALNGFATQSDSNHWKATIHVQLSEAQNQIIASWLAPQSKKLELNYWTLLGPPAELKCWRDIDKNDENFTTVVESCTNPNPVHYNDQILTSNIRISYTEASINPKSFTNEKLNTLHRSGMTQIRAETKAIDGTLSSPSCSGSVIVNSKNVQMKANFCISSYKRTKNLINFSFKVTTIEKETHPIHIYGTLSGFTLDNSKKAISEIIESLERKK